MSVVFNVDGEAAKRTTGIVAGNSNYSCCFYARNNAPTAAGGKTLFITYNGAGIYTNWAAIFATDTGFVQLDVNNGGGVAPVNFAWSVGTWYRIAYVRSGTAQRFYVNNTLIGTSTLDLSAVTFDETWIGDDGGGIGHADLEIAYFREWDTALSLTELNFEWNSATPVKTANLITDTPLFSDLLDDSGNGNDWTAVGTLSFDSALLIPPNTSPATAVELGPLPNSIDQTVDNSGFTFEVYYKYLAQAGDTVIGLWARGQASLTPYNPRIRVYDNIAVITALVDSSGSLRIQVGVTATTTYYIRITSNSGNPSPALLRISGLEAPNDIPVNGDILVNDDTAGFPLAIVSPSVNFEVRKYVNPFPSGEAGDILPNGNILVDNIADNNLKLYDKEFNLLATVAFQLDTSQGGMIRANRVTNKFWAVDNDTPGNVRKIAADGTIELSIALPALGNFLSIAANIDDTILYLSTNGSNSAIKRYDIGTAAFISDLAAGVAGYTAAIDILVLEDDSILITYGDQSPADVFIRRYDPTGAILNTYALGSDFGFPFGIWPRLAAALDSPDSFWVWNQSLDSDPGISLFTNIRTSDGVVLGDVTHQVYEFGAYASAQTLLPNADFGISFSCPFFILNGLEEETGSITVLKLTNPNDPVTEFDFVTDLTPNNFTLLSDEERTFSDLEPGSVWSIVEEPNADWYPVYTVSNDPDNDNEHIVVEAGVDITVIVWNTRSSPGGGLFEYPLPGNPNPNGGLPPGSGKTDDDFPEQDGTVSLVKIPNPYFITGFVKD